MSDSYFDYIEREGQMDREERRRDAIGRFCPPPEPDIRRSILSVGGVADCHFCGVPIFPGDPIYHDDVTFQQGCSEEHCREATKLKLVRHS